ncbi:MAG TPA: choice-of-anchor tandem repeat GloVer-containing protein, partial [Candidatus Binatia bacterium]|nr:choice-of-anchor tandem repeat GloVer-containing protein [Candidatus Binatia bacterium]
MSTISRKSIQRRLIVFVLMLGSVCFMATGALAQQVLVAGGATNCSGGGCTYTSTAEVFDPSTMSWSPTSNDIPNPPPTGLCSPNMVLLGNGEVLLAGGGCSNQGDTTNAASLYNPTTNQWAATGPGMPGMNLPYFMNYGRDQYGMVPIMGGNALAFAGCSGGCTETDNQGYGFGTVGDSAEIYNFQSNTWTVVANLNVYRGNLETSNVNQDVVALQDGRVMTCNGSNGVNDVTSTCEIYDPNANTWTLTGSIGGSNEVGPHQLVLLSTGKVLTVLDDGLSASLFDPTSGTWSPTGSLTSTQFQGQLVKLSDGRVLDCGGHDSGDIPISTAQIYDPITGQWSATGSMTTARVGHVSVLLLDGTVLVAGGMNSEFVILSSAEIFNPSLGTWSATAPMTLQRFDANALLIGNFSQQTYVLTVSTSGSGSVTSTDGGINCPGTCGNSYPVDPPVTVTLNAMPANGWSFAGWGGAGASCGTNPSCMVTMTQDQSVTAAFTQNADSYTLNVAISGSGTVTSGDGFINCPGVCSYTYPSNTPVTLTENPGRNGTFSGWNGACTGTGSCMVTMTQNQFVTATFTGQPDVVTHSFGTGNGDGKNPFGGLVLDSAGNLYGTTSTAGINGFGTVFKLSADGTETVLYNFGNGNGDGQNPLGTLIFDSAQINLFGTTSAGGTFGKGTVFELSPKAGGGWTGTV